MANKQRELSQEEYEKLLSQHKKDLAALENNLDAEKQRQHKSLQDKVCLYQQVTIMTVVDWCYT